MSFDFSKLKFDICILKSDGIKTHAEFDNKKSGFAKLYKRLKNESDKHFALEATGVYGESLCQYLFMKKQSVFLLNPIQTARYFQCMLKIRKTDKCDAINIAMFLNHHKDELIPWKPRSKTFNTIKNLHHCLQDLNGDRKRVLGRIEACTSTTQDGRAQALKHYKKLKKFYDKQKEDVLKQLRSLVEKDEEVNDQYNLLVTIPGVGEITAFGSTANPPYLTRFKCAKQLAAFAGLNPGIRESGSSIKGRGSICKTGSKNLRSVLYMPALVSKKCCKPMFKFAGKLIEKGKKPKVAVVAVMHKLIRIVFAVLTKGQVFNEDML
jgi:transposase